MDSTNAIEVKGLKKKFTVRYTTFYGGTAKSGVKEVLEDISFNLKKGEVLGIIGKNGSGKSTLLKILAGIMDPESGTKEIKGTVASILELGMGFDSEASGRDNIRMKCGLYGMSSQDIEGCMADIILFSELGDQIDHPLRTYSSGMVAKLAFSVLMHIKSDILIIDEVLSVGDAGFNAKCKLAFEKMKKGGRSILMASHNLNSIETMCDRVLWIDNGTIRESGDPLATCYHYQSDIIGSFDTVYNLAESGDIVSINRLGVMYRDGIDTSKDLIKAEQCFIKASSMGYSESQLNLADMKLKMGEVDSARELYEKASQAGNTLAIVSLLQLDEDPNEKNAFKECVRVLADSGNMRACKLLADMLYNGVVFLKDQVEAVRWYLKCANAHNNQAQFTLGICYRDGIGVQKDPLQAIKWFEEASNHGNNRARIELANIYRKGIGIEVDINRAIYWYEKASELGDKNSMLQLGLIYRDGLGVDRDSTKSSFWMKKYANADFANYEVVLGDIFKQGFSDLNSLSCIEWYKNAADKGNQRAINMLAGCFRAGNLMIPDSNALMNVYLTHSPNLDSNGMFDLAMLLLSGNGGKKNPLEAMKYMKQSALFGNQKAMLQYALYEIKNNGDMGTAWAMLSLLDELGNLIARSYIKGDNKFQTK